MRPVIVTDSAIDVVTLIEAKNWLKVDFGNDDSLITSLIKAAVSFIEKKILISLKPREYQQLFNEEDFAVEGCFKLLVNPVTSVTEVKMKVGSQDETTWVLDEDYRIDGRVVNPGFYKVWGNSFKATIKFNAGFTPETLPEDLKVCVLQIVTEWYQNRKPTVEGTIIQPIPFTAKDILRAYSSQTWFG